MKSMPWFRSAALSAALSVALPVTIPSALAASPGAGAPAKPAPAESASADPDRSMDRLMRAAQTLRESVQSMAKLPPGDERSRAMERARDALLETQSAMVALAPIAVDRGKEAGAGDDYARSLERLELAAQRLREGIQALAQRAAGTDRDRAIRQANDALLQTQQAMARFNAVLARGPQHEAATGRGADGRASGG